MVQLKTDKLSGVKYFNLLPSDLDSDLKREYYFKLLSNTFKLNKKLQLFLNKYLQYRSQYSTSVNIYFDKGLLVKELHKFYINRLPYMGYGDHVDSKPKPLTQQYKESTYPFENFKSGQWIGVEIECILPIPESILNDDELDQYSDEYFESCRSWLRNVFSKKDCNFVEVKYDGSLQRENDSQFTAEITFCFPKTEHYYRLNKVLSILNELGATVNKSCGLHIHLDMRGYSEATIEQYGTRLINSLPVLKKLVPKSRWATDDTYCQINSKFTWQPDDRYFAVNMLAYEELGTIEVRLHSGTTNFLKIKNWIELLNHIKSYNGVNSDKLTKNRIRSNPVIWFFENIDLPKDLQRFYLQREVLFENNRANEENNNDNLDIQGPSSRRRDRTIFTTRNPLDSRTLNIQPMAPIIDEVVDYPPIRTTETPRDLNGTIDAMVNDWINQSTNMLDTNIISSIESIYNQMAYDYRTTTIGNAMTDNNIRVHYDVEHQSVVVVHPDGTTTPITLTNGNNTDGVA